jgi:molybdopterin-guanine dinucleotide biosynthesis protein A
VNPTAAPVYGLILAGGASSRMHRDKAALLYQGRTQLARAFDLASGHLDRVFVSVRASQTGEPTRSDKPLIVDLAGLGPEGPIVGIRSAMTAYPDVAWLVIACDLPFLSHAALAQLLEARDPGVLATAFRSAHDGLPEPLCAIWEPAAAPALAEYQSGGGHCPRKFLRRYPASLIDPDDRRALDNVNTPEEYSDAQAKIETRVGANPMQLKIQYFALMREQAGRSDETLETSAATPADLFEELTARYGFTLSREQLKVAVNAEFSDWSRRLIPGDAVVFIPPVAGG